MQRKSFHGLTTIPVLGDYDMMLEVINFLCPLYHFLGGALKYWGTRLLHCSRFTLLRIEPKSTYSDHVLLVCEMTCVI